MLDDLPAPFTVAAIKIWPVHSRPEFQWFIAFEGKPYYFKTKSEALLFVRDRQAIDDPEFLCD